jgi:NADH dehydrogenase/NADH:ubiquinone oxidoreductase subunit G
MFDHVRPAGATLTIYVNDDPVAARFGDTVAAALLAAGVLRFRLNAADGSGRGPWCLMGVCQDCRVTIDGRPGMQACAIPVTDGMRIETDVPERDDG